MLRAVRRAVDRAVVLATLLVAAPAAAQVQSQPYSLRTYAGCGTFFCVDYTATWTERVYPATPNFPREIEYFVGVSGTLTLLQAALDAGFTGIGCCEMLWAAPLSVNWDPGIIPVFPNRSFVGRVAGDELAFFASGQSRGTTHFGSLEFWAAGPPGMQRVRTFAALTSNVSLVTPEPSTYALLGTGLLIVGGVAARRRQRATT
ncbi:PEP-CTERM sorting domain-containing protein [Roseisolibacter sp. H3M3-2]|uniref:PEP-CTERM sorting domain-containing protein n=1 Tax=Roseisolibacter sp. H3M3-2 TaxID=3031323 RepID=UPI0023DBEA7E|nr:PEP-CTERM sorting domain-containing protein [Roseisolibacter sp. H3M3-2]MDF1505059.1 PEP-CTERM sorting domain-containing protein [Roseisolibacter sp. H3M3-2]